MRAEEKKNPAHLGFLTVLGNPSEGLIGGFLVLNRVGRPMEFHCTAPVRPNRAQEILYGNTLEGFVCGEQIAPALVGRTKTELVAILTNNPNLLTAPALLPAPIGLVFTRVQNENVDKEQYALWDVRNDGVKNEKIDNVPLNAANMDAVDGVNDTTNHEVAQVGSFFYDSLDSAPLVPGVDYSLWREAVRGKNRMALPVEFSVESGEKIGFSEIVKKIDPFLKFIDSIEPFERIRLAVEEAQKSC